MTAVLYAGRTCNLQELHSQHIRDLYPRTDVQAVLTEYRPWYRPKEHSIDAMMGRNQWLTQLSPRPEIEAVIVSTSCATPLGFICMSGIDSVNLKAELSIGMFRRQGTKAPLEAMHWALEVAFANLHKVVFCVSPVNIRAIRLLDALGIPFEARLSQEVLTPDGARKDLLRYAVLATDWNKGPTRQLLQRLAPLRPATAS